MKNIINSKNAYTNRQKFLEILYERYPMLQMHSAGSGRNRYGHKCWDVGMYFEDQSLNSRASLEFDCYEDGKIVVEIVSNYKSRKPNESRKVSMQTEGTFDPLNEKFPLWLDMICQRMVEEK